MNVVSQDPVARRRSRLSLIFVLGMFAAPLAIAWLVLSVFPEWAPKGKVNHGELVSPARPLPAFQLQTLLGEAVDETFFRGKWTIVYLAQGNCDRPCVEQLYNIRQVRLAQGKNIDRLQRLLLWKDEGISSEQRLELQEHFPGQVIVPLSDQASPGLLKTFVLDAKQPLDAGRVYLVDPLGHLMMSYEPEDEPRGMIKDLERLLKYSGLG
jgi:cytochrome oxidase Cu insertion factor (SCO1/SenC/PrrC family)